MGRGWKGVEMACKCLKNIGEKNNIIVHRLLFTIIYHVIFIVLLFNSFLPRTRGRKHSSAKDQFIRQMYDDDNINDNLIRKIYDDDNNNNNKVITILHNANSNSTKTRQNYKMI